MIGGAEGGAGGANAAIEGTCGIPGELEGMLGAPCAFGNLG